MREMIVCYWSLSHRGLNTNPLADIHGNTIHMYKHTHIIEHILGILHDSGITLHRSGNALVPFGICRSLPLINGS